MLEEEGGQQAFCLVAKRMRGTIEFLFSIQLNKLWSFHRYSMASRLVIVYHFFHVACCGIHIGSVVIVSS